ncbi:hypothetical protein CVT24_001736 [Panaeolus cyanescens]|uniref:Uncharacterized protein n=1 Tax=Panaeolus cyanescens TaxID=181874 RepID=A0A409YFS9_9AGAR|nr:hypothetical protein CVT24_001736 [Panaeolus cyanescens]
MYLSRTGDADLIIQINAAESKELDVEELRSCYQMLYSVSSRWKSISFYIGETARKEFEQIFCLDEKSTSSSSSTPPVRFPALESLSVATARPAEMMERDEYGFATRFCEARLIAPRIIQFGGLFMSGFGLPTPKYIASNQRMQAIVSLSLVRRQFGNLRALFSSLAMLGSLETLDLKHCWTPTYNDVYEPRITLPHLRRLTIEDLGHHSDAEAIFLSVLLPNLQDVTMAPPLHTPSFLGMANLSECKIRRLHLTANYTFYEYLFYFLSASAFSKLEDLTLEADVLENKHILFFDISPAIFEVPKIDKQVATPVFPTTLKYLTLLGCYSDDGLLGKVAMSRMKDGALKHFYAEVVEDVQTSHKKDYDVVRELQRSGYDADQIKGILQVNHDHCDDPVPFSLSTSTSMASCDLLVVEPEDLKQRKPPPLNDIIPTDIWVEVFLQVHRKELSEKFKEEILPEYTWESRTIPRSPMIFSHVCRHWRDIAVSQPLLWRNIFICSWRKSPYALLQLYVSRAVHMDLIINIDAYSASSSLDVEELQLCFKRLYSMSGRWKSVSFKIGETARKEFEQIFCLDEEGDIDSVSTPQARFPALESLSVATARPVESMEWDEYGFAARFCEAGLIAPQIIRFGGIYMDRLRLPNSSYIKSNARMQAIVSLTLVRRQFGNLRWVFSRLAMLGSLETLEINCCCTSTYHEVDEPRISLPHLRRISIKKMGHHTDIEAIFLTVLLPSLEDVSLAPPLHTPSFLGMANLSECKIRRLHLTANYTFYEYLFYFLSARAFTQLEDLTLEADILEGEHIRFFDISASPAIFEIKKIIKQVTTPVFPATLKYLTLLGCSSEDGLLGKVAMSRMKKGALTYFYAEVVEDVQTNHKKDYEIVRELQRSGYDADIRRGRQA